MSEKYYDDVETNTIKTENHDTFCMHFSFIGWDVSELEGIDFVEDEMNRLHARVQELEAELEKYKTIAATLKGVGHWSADFLPDTDQDNDANH